MVTWLKQSFWWSTYEMCHPKLKTWISWGVVNISRFVKASTFLGSITLPSLDIMKTRIVLENTMNAHLFGFKLIPNYLFNKHLKKHFMSFSRWVNKLLKTIKSSRKIFMNTSMYFWNVLITTPLIMGGSFLTPNDITTHTKGPQFITKVVLCWSFRVIDIWWYMKNPSKKV